MYLPPGWDLKTAVTWVVEIAVVILETGVDGGVGDGSTPSPVINAAVFDLATAVCTPSDAMPPPTRVRIYRKVRPRMAVARLSCLAATLVLMNPLAPLEMVSRRTSACIVAIGPLSIVSFVNFEELS